MDTARIKRAAIVEDVTLMWGERTTERLVRTVHIDVHRLEDGDLHERIDPRTIQQTGDIKGDGSGVEGEQVGVFHQRTAALQELLPYRGRRLLVPTGEELLETGRASLLTPAVVGIVIIEHTREECALGQLFVDGTLLTVTVEFASRLSQQEIEMDLTVVIRQGTLGRMTAETRHHCQEDGSDAPRERQARNGLMPQAHDDRDVDGGKPQIA